MADSQAVQLIKFLESLPPQVNKYEAAAKAVSVALLPASYPRWCHRLVIAIAVLFAVQMLVALAAVGVSIKGAGGRAWFMRKGRHGVWLVNTVVCYCLLAASFCACNVVCMTWHALYDDNKAPLRNLILIEGLRWIPLWFAAYLFMHGLGAQLVQLSEKSGPSSSRFWGPDAAALALNFCFIAVPLTVAATAVVLFSLASHKLNTAMGISDSVVASLISLAPSYDPQTFRLPSLLLALEPLQPVSSLGNTFNDLIRVGWAMWGGYTFLLTIAFTPMLIRHLRILHRLGGMDKFSDTLAALCCGIRKGYKTPSTTLELPTMLSSTSSGSHGQTSTKLSPSPLELKKVKPVRAQGSPPGTMSISSLMWSAIFVYFDGFVHVPLAIYTAQTTLQDPVFQTAVVFWGSLTYAILGLFINTGFLARTISSARVAERVRTTQDEPRSGSHLPASQEDRSRPSRLSRASRPDARRFVVEVADRDALSSGQEDDAWDGRKDLARARVENSSQGIDLHYDLSKTI